MSIPERLRQAIGQQEHRLRASMPPDRDGALFALLRAQDRLSLDEAAENPPDLITGRRLTGLGGNKALQLCLEADGGTPAEPDAGWDAWAEHFLEQCGRLAEAELILGHVETGFMRLIEAGDGAFHAWIATKRPPTSWRERADIDWWATWLAGQVEPELRAMLSARLDPGRRDETFYRELADLYLRRMAYQLGYPLDTTLGGCTIQTYRAVLGGLIALALQARDRGTAPAAQSESALVAALAAALAADPEAIARAVDAFTLDRTAAAFHAGVPGVAAAPLVRLGPDRLAWSLHGLTTEPLLFLTREVRRRRPEAYNNAAHLREAVFRHDLYALFPDKRFVTSGARIQLRRDDGNVRTDVDAVIFDRKTGTLGLFELKSQDPFARSAAEQARQRDNVLYANRQVSGVLTWLKRHGGDDILNRVDPRTAKTFRVQKVVPFVLGRYLVHFTDGPEPDRRAAWGTWPQVLRLLDGQPVRAADASPIASLFTRLTKDTPLLQPPANAPPREIDVGESLLVVHPSYAALQAIASVTL